MSTKAYGYRRYSSKRQEKGSSEERQLELCQAMADRHGWEIVENIADLGVSAWKGDHLTSGNLGKFADRVRSGEIEPGSVLIAEKLDRLSREDPHDANDWLREMTKLGLRVATVDGDRVYDRASLRENLMETFEILMRGKLAHEFVENLSGRVGDSWERKRKAAKENGKILTRQVPAWITLGPNGERNENKSNGDIVRLIYQMAADGIGHRTIARTLNDTIGVSFSGKPKGWDPAYISRLLQSPTVEGDYVPGTVKGERRKLEDRFVGYFPRVVDADLVARARASTATRAKSGGATRNEFANLFAGLLRCSGCGGSVTARVTTRGKYRTRHLVCHGAHRGSGCEDKGFFRYDDIEPAVLDTILPLALDDRFFKRPEMTLPLVNELASLRKLLADKDGEAGRLVSLLSRIESPTTEAALIEVEAERSTLKTKIETLSAELERARGSVEAGEHARRVLDVRDSMASDDAEVRLAARRKVSEALKGVIDVMITNTDDEDADGEKTITVILAGGVHAIKFSNRGAVLATGDASDTLNERSYLVWDQAREQIVRVTSNPDAARLGLTGGNVIRDERLNGFVRRRAQA